MFKVAEPSEPAVREVHTPPATAANGIKIRIITPALAKSHQNISTIPLLQGGVYIPLSTSLWNLKTKVANSLGHTLGHTCPSRESQSCNCSFVEYLLKQELLRCLDDFVVVFDDHKIERLPVSEPTGNSIFQALQARFETEVESQYNVSLEGGELGSEQRYLIMPAVALCSKDLHLGNLKAKGRPVPDEGSKPHGQTIKQEDMLEDDWYDLDLHIAEAPIEVLDPYLTLENASLNECTVNGILNLYVVERRCLSTPLSASLGKEAIFSQAPCWQTAPQQSRRGMSAYLSSLRVFTHLINAAFMEARQQDEVLGQIFTLTHFPPAMLAVYVLMQGNTPRASQCAALIQALTEVLKEMVPLHLIGGDETRSLEGSRLLFGFMLAKAKQRANFSKNSPLNYMNSITTVDLLNPGTLRPILHPVSTSMGMLEESFFQALHTPGLFEHSTEERPIKMLDVDLRQHRLALITGGLVPEVCALDIDHLNAHIYRDSVTANSQKPIWDLTNLASICEANGLAVIAPSDLARTKSPMLSLDKECFLSVYLGKVPCGDPTKE